MVCCYSRRRRRPADDDDDGDAVHTRSIIKIISLYWAAVYDYSHIMPFGAGVADVSHENSEKRRKNDSHSCKHQKYTKW